jgi:LacI family transcriptional regulator
MEAAQARRDGYKQALLEAGIAIESALIVNGDFTQESGYEAMCILLSQSPRPTAVFVASDTMAIGAMRAIHECGLSVPRDIALVGFDDLSPAVYATPPLTTVRQPVAELGATAVHMLIERIKRPDAPVAHVRLPAQLVIRGSCGATTAPLSTKGG